MTVRHRARWWYVLLAILTIVAGLAVHRGGGALGALAQDVSGDALWAMMIAWWIGALLPLCALAMRSAIAWSICVMVELSQLVHTPSLDALRDTTLGGLILGHDFDLRDLLAYAAGVAVATLLESIVVRQHPQARNIR